MKKCNLCYDRSSQGLMPWCAQVCPTQAIWYADYEEFVAQRRGHAVNHTVFGEQDVRTRVYHVLPAEVGQLEVTQLLDQAAAELGHEQSRQEAWVV
jgi:Fe-S-cluster-containing dehydrogenase component